MTARRRDGGGRAGDAAGRSGDPGGEGGGAGEAGGPRGDRLRWLLLAGVILLSVVAVSAAFNPAPHTGGDNAGYVSLAYSLLQDGRYAELFDPAANPHTKYPPVFPVLLALLMALGVRTWAGLKLVAAASTVAAVVATWLWAERRLGPLAAAGVAAALALSSAVVYYSHWILSDPTFLAFTLVGLWALDRADGAAEAAGAASDDGGWKGWWARASSSEAPIATGWLVAGVVATGLAYFTRSAGLPLLVAVLAWLALRRRFRALAVSAAALGLPALLWFLRGRGVADAQGEYVAEFWLVNPYDPGLGRVSLGGLAGRMVDNAVGYVGAHIPGGVVGQGGSLVSLLGVALVVLALAGWVAAARRRVGPVELFFPLYAGLVLLWPQVWSGDRFALPLYPVLFVYAASALLRGGARLGSLAPRLVGAAALLVVLLPALQSWTEAIRTASTCGALVREGGAFACYGPRWARFAQAAGWSGASLPEGSAVLSRKPRLFYVLSGVPSRTFPFDPRASAHLGEADAVGARYVLLDQIDGQATRFVGAAIQEAPGAWCALRGFGAGEGIGTQLLGILPPGDRGGGAGEGGEIRIPRCPASYLGPGTPGSEAYSSSSRIPLLDGLP